MARCQTHCIGVRGLRLDLGGGKQENERRCGTRISSDTVLTSKLNLPRELIDSAPRASWAVC